MPASLRNEIRCSPATPGSDSAWRPARRRSRSTPPAGPSAASTRAITSGGHLDAGDALVDESQRLRACAGCRSTAAARSARRARTRRAGDEPLEQLGPVADLQLQEARAGVGLLLARAAGGRRTAARPGSRPRRRTAAAPARSRGPRGSGRRRCARASATSCGPSRSNTRRASGSSPAVTSSPVRQQMFSIPCSAAPTMSACSASRLRSRQVSCMIGSTPSARSAIATASGEACARADGLSVALTASRWARDRLELRRDRVQPAAVDHRQLAGDHELARGELTLERRHRRIPAGRGLVVAAAEQVGPRRGPLERVVDRRAQLVDVAAPQRQRSERS